MEKIGKTPLIQLNSLSQRFNADIRAKVEGDNPGMSVKDRIVRHMIDRAEERGDITPGISTVVESSSGNTGHSLAMLCALKNYNCVVTVKDSASEEKIALIEAFGAQVVRCPASAKADDPSSYYQVARRLSEEIPNAFYLDQNYNEDNYLAHSLTTGPEIWDQTGGKVSHVIASASTGGTISGVGKYLKNMNPDIQIIGVDCEGSALSQIFYNGKLDDRIEKKTCLEGVGKDILPANFKPEFIDAMITVDDEDSINNILALAKADGIIAGGSSGATINGLKHIAHTLNHNSLVVMIFADHGCKYMSKYYNEGWRKQKGLEKLQRSMTENGL